MHLVTAFHSLRYRLSVFCFEWEGVVFHDATLSINVQQDLQLVIDKDGNKQILHFYWEVPPVQVTVIRTDE